MRTSKSGDERSSWWGWTPPQERILRLLIRVSSPREWSPGIKESRHPTLTLIVLSWGLRGGLIRPTERQNAPGPAFLGGQFFALLSL